MSDENKPNSKKNDFFVDFMEKSIKSLAPYKTMIIGLCVGAVVAFAAFNLMKYIKEKNEIDAQTKLFVIQNKISTKEKAFAETIDKQLAELKDKTDKKSVELKQELAAKKISFEELATEVEELKSFVKAESDSLAADLATQDLVNILMNYKKTEEALSLMQDHDKNLDKSNQNYVFFAFQLANLLIAQENFEQAQAKFLEISNLTTAPESLKNIAKLQNALVLHKLGKQDDAMRILMEISDSNPEDQIGKEAKKYLRVISTGV